MDKAERLAKELNGRAFPLSELRHYKEGFDILITCTGSTEPVITSSIYASLLNGETSKKIVVDLAIPNDVSEEVLAENAIHYIEVSGLQAIANKNLQERYNELIHAERIIESNVAEFLPILKQRKVEIAMRQVPERVKEIKSFALNTVFANELNSLDASSREVLEKVINYMEKKYISGPMVLAKEILIAKSKEAAEN
jgi:glutamyl-tRNA reductase